MTDIEIAIARVDAAAVEMEAAIKAMRDAMRRAGRGLDRAQGRAIVDAHNRARRSVA